MDKNSLKERTQLKTKSKEEFDQLRKEIRFQDPKGNAILLHTVFLILFR